MDPDARWSEEFVACNLLLTRSLQGPSKLEVSGGLRFGAVPSFTPDGTASFYSYVADRLFRNGWKVSLNSLQQFFNLVLRKLDDYAEQFSDGGTPARESRHRFNLLIQPTCRRQQLAAFFLTGLKCLSYLFNGFARRVEPGAVILQS